MSIGWICPKCGRALAPWISECPCYLDKTVITTNSTTAWGNVQAGKCNRICSNKTDMGYCRTTACIKPEYIDNEDYGRGTYA